MRRVSKREHDRKALTAMNIEASKEKQNPISAKVVRKASGRCLPSRSMSASVSVQAESLVSLVNELFCSSSIVENTDTGHRTRIYIYKA